jgi:WD40 repeat protein
VSGAWDRSVRLWDLDRLKEARRFDIEADAAMFSADGRHVLIGGRDRDVTFWLLPP